MKHIFSIIFTYLPLGLGILILALGSAFVPWHQVGPYIAKIPLESYLILAVLGVAFYFCRIFRYGYMLDLLGEKIPFRKVILAYFVAQPISLLPAGEMYRSVMLKKHGNVKLINGIPVVFVQSFTENIGLVVMALIGAVILQKYVLLVIAVAVLYLAIIIAVQFRKTARKSHKIINKVPFVKVSRHRLFSFHMKNRTLLSGKSLVILLATSFVSSGVAILALHIAAQSMHINLSLVEAAIAFSLPMILQNLTFLPGGLGVNEQSSVGVFLLFGISLPAAVALTLVLRFITLVLGVVIGVLVSGIDTARKRFAS